MSDELDKELDELAATRGPTTLERAMAALSTIVELSQQGHSKLAICKRLGLQYSIVCKAEKKNQALYEAFKGIPPVAGDVPGVVAYSRRLEEDPASPENLKKIQKWARDGVSRAAMSALLKMTEEQFAGFVKNVPRIADAIRYGEAEREATACDSLYKLVSDPLHKDHLRAVLAMIGKNAIAKPKDEPEEEAVITPDQILEALRKPAR